MRIQGRDQVAFAKGASLGCRAVPHTVVAVGAGGALSRPGCGPAESEGASLRRGVSDRGPQMSLSLLGGGGGLRTRPYLGRSRAEWEGRGIFGGSLQAPRGLQLGTPGADPSRTSLGARGRAEPPTCSVHLPARAARGRPSVSQSVSPSASPRAASLHGRPAGPALPGARPAPQRAPDSARRAGQVGARGASLRAGRGGTGRGGGASAEHARRWPGQRAASRSLAIPRGARGKWGRGARASRGGAALAVHRGGEGARVRRAWGGGRGSARRRVRSGSRLRNGRAALWAPRLCCRRASAPS